MNPDKWEEFRALFRPYPEVQVTPPEGLIRNPEKLALVETHNTYLENSIAKARLVNQGCHYPALADDTGLEVDALDRKPGIHTFRYAKPAPGQPAFSKAAQCEANIQLLLNELKKTSASSRAARFVTVLALNMEGILIHSTGVLEGSIADSPRGSYGFGYDPIFIPQGSQKTLAEMTEGEKNAISHRARAVQDLMEQVRARGIVFAKP